MWTKGLWSVCMSLALFGFLGVVRAGEAKEGEPAKDRPTKADVKEDTGAKLPEPKPLEPKTRPIAKEDLVAKVGEIQIGRADLEAARRFFTATNPQVQLTGKQALEQVINRILWSQHFEKKGLRPTADELRQAVAQMDKELRQRQGITYQDFIKNQGLTVEAHLGLLAYDLAMRKLVADIQSKIPDDEVKAEYDAHPDWYDGSKVRLSQIFVDTSNLDKAEQEKAKQRIDTIYGKLAGADFDNVASFYTEGGGAGMGGDRGWFTRKGAEVDEPLMSAVWTLKVGDYTKPIQGARGWQILKVTGRDPAIYTPFGCRPSILNELARKRLESLLGELKKDAKIEIYM